MASDGPSPPRGAAASGGLFTQSQAKTIGHHSLKIFRVADAPTKTPAGNSDGNTVIGGLIEDVTWSVLVVWFGSQEGLKTGVGTAWIVFGRHRWSTLSLGRWTSPNVRPLQRHGLRISPLKRSTTRKAQVCVACSGFYEACHVQPWNKRQKHFNHTNQKLIDAC